MKSKHKKKKWFKRSIRIVGMHPTSFEESWKIRISNTQIISALLLFFIILFLFNYLVFAYTPLGYLLPENIKNRNKQKIELAIAKASELEKKTTAQTKYISNLQKVILGEISIDSIFINQEEKSFIKDIDIDTTMSEVEKELDKNLKLNTEKPKQNQEETFNHLFLFDPVEGEISQKYNFPNHIGVDIVTQKDAQIKSCLGGIVLYSSYNDQDGHVIIISHKNEIISVYKHAKAVYVKIGDQVKTGETIGIVGSTGEQSTGPHLHFELWNERGPLNPVNYFSFGK